MCSSDLSTVFTIGNSAGINTSSSSHVMYSFAEVEGFSKFGSYTGNGSTDGAFIYTGFKPDFVMIKRTNSTGDWVIKSSTIDPTNPLSPRLLANLANAESASDYIIDALSNGFKLRDSQAAVNASGSTYSFMAFAESPFKTATAR